LKFLDLPNAACEALAWSGDGRNLAVGVGSKIRLLNADTLAEEKVFSGHSDLVRSLAWSPDGLRLASAGDDSSVVIWDVNTGAPINSLLGHAASVHSVAWNPDGTRLVTGSWDLSVKIWEPDTGAEVCSFQTPGGIIQMIDAVAWSRDGRRIACSDIEGQICILDSTLGWPSGETNEVKTVSTSARNSEAETIRSLRLYCAAVEPHAANNADALRRLAWILSTCRYPEVRDGPKAVALAQQASQLIGGSNASVLSILAAAYAEAGDFTNAIQTQKRALALVSGTESRAELAAELRLYEAHQPVRDNSW
jgi:hypothetical protein